MPGAREERGDSEPEGREAVVREAVVRVRYPFDEPLKTEPSEAVVLVAVMVPGIEAQQWSEVCSQVFLESREAGGGSRRACKAVPGHGDHRSGVPVPVDRSPSSVSRPWRRRPRRSGSRGVRSTFKRRSAVHHVDREAAWSRRRHLPFSFSGR